MAEKTTKEIALLREALNAAIGMIDGIGRNVPWTEEAELEDALNEALHELAALGYTEEIN